MELITGLLAVLEFRFCYITNHGLFDTPGTGCNVVQTINLRVSMSQLRKSPWLEGVIEFISTHIFTWCPTSEDDVDVIYVIIGCARSHVYN